MQIEDLVDSTIMQLYPLDFAKRLVKTFMDSTAPAEPEPAPAPAPTPQAAPTPQQQPQQPQMQPGMGMDQSMNGMPNMGMPNMGMGMPGMMMPGMMPNMQQMNVQPAQFQSFNPEYAAMQANENIGLIMDVPLNVTVELGRTSKSISEILDFAPGTIIELDKIAGEPIDVLVNGKFVAKGEVVVIEESFAVRITEIIK